MLVFQYQPLSIFFQEAQTLQWKIRINRELTELDRVKPYIGKILQEESIAVESIQDAQLIVEEILVNIIEYGDNNQHPCFIDLEIKIEDNTLTMVFQDDGKPFNPLTEILPPDLSMNDEVRSSGGLGFYLVQEICDRIDYDYHNGKNILTTYQNISKT